MKQRGLKQRSVAVLKRVIGYMLHYYKILFALVHGRGRDLPADAGG